MLRTAKSVRVTFFVSQIKALLRTKKKNGPIKLLLYLTAVVSANVFLNKHWASRDNYN